MSSRVPILAAWAAGIALGSLPSPSPAQTTAVAANATLVPLQSEIVFTTRQMGVPVAGRFAGFDARVVLDPARPAGGSVAIAIDTTSARFGTAELDAEIGKPTWLASARFPQSTFQSTSVRAGGDGRYEVAGRLTIKGTTRAVVVPVRLARAGARATAIGAFTLKRLDFGVGEGEWADSSLLANEVEVRFRLVLDGLPPP